MTATLSPAEALFAGERPFPVIASCEHYAGSEALIGKALALQDQFGPVFDVTMDCEDGAPAGRERQHAEMVVDLLRQTGDRRGLAGVRIHDHSHPAWRQDVDIVLRGAGARCAYLTIPKPTSAAQVSEMLAYIRQVAGECGLERDIPVHVLIETHGGLREVEAIAALPWVQVLDFGLMDFVSDHHGAIPAAAMRSPGQFEHALIARAKTLIAAAALAHGLVPSHNVCLDLKNPYQTWADARRARDQFGFLRMWSVHPAQIRPIVDAMQPDFSEVELACRVLLAAARAEWGPIQLDGQLHDRATYRYYWQLVRRAQVSGQALPDEVQAWLA
ncbi:HpcH/HpaI aldolase/citrate lyase family protein [Haliangium sp.]|uniref:HpcH/HpaI aldolase/citrate lyase family protein n=1 Tax=Haliangium sp. TaxID=2663208 RepID=UPI003D0B9D23